MKLILQQRGRLQVLGSFLVDEFDSLVARIRGSWNVERSEQGRGTQIALPVGMPALRHGHSINFKQTYIYGLWARMKGCCLNDAHRDFHRYGGRGITVWAPWISSFERFRDDVIALIGERPSRRHSLDRIDNDGNYEPGNVRWADKATQNQNTRRTRLSASKVAVIKRLASRGDLSHRNLGWLFGVTHTTIGQALREESWAS